MRANTCSRARFSGSTCATGWSSIAAMWTGTATTCRKSATGAGPRRREAGARCREPRVFAGRRPRSRADREPRPHAPSLPRRRVHGRISRRPASARIDAMTAAQRPAHVVTRPRYPGGMRAPFESDSRRLALAAAGVPERRPRGFSPAVAAVGILPRRLFSKPCLTFHPGRFQSGRAPDREEPVGERVPAFDLHQAPARGHA
ncbi:hypothetical protein EMIT0111MI5_40415 [Burkholderia sp. IT-111MI5]